jgi:triosephosphate isomerase
MRAAGASSFMMRRLHGLHIHARVRTHLVCQASSQAKFLVGGNWKSNGSRHTVRQLVDGLNAGASIIDPQSVDVVVAPTYVHLDYVNRTLDGKFHVASQNMWIKGPGAYTGEISGETLTDLGINWVIVGHSERRALCSETNEVVGEKTARALALGMSVIPCIGETLQQRESGQMFSVLEGQLQALIDRVKDWSKVVIAYEPVWAIGTGVVATPEQAQEVHAYIRQLLEQRLGRDVASKLRILYGGSVNDSNCQVLAALPDVDGFLVGGASLQAESFLKIIASHSAKLQTAH